MGRRSDPKEITKEKLLLVEGADEVNFFNALFRHVNQADIQVASVGGRDNFKNEIPMFVKARGFGRLTKWAVIRDAEESEAINAFKSARNILEKALKELNESKSLDQKIKYLLPGSPGEFSSGSLPIGIFILPDNSQPGMLEDLCLKTVEDHPAMKCVNDFYGCCKKLKKPPENEAKSKAEAFLAAMPKAMRKTSEDGVGIGAQKKYWNFDSEHLNPLKFFLSHLE